METLKYGYLTSLQNFIEQSSITSLPIFIYFALNLQRYVSKGIFLVSGISDGEG